VFEVGQCFFHRRYNYRGVIVQARARHTPRFDWPGAALAECMLRLPFPLALWRGHSPLDTPPTPVHWTCNYPLHIRAGEF
jgi:hypothetical protein